MLLGGLARVVAARGAGYMLGSFRLPSGDKVVRWTSYVSLGESRERALVFRTFIRSANRVLAPAFSSSTV